MVNIISPDKGFVLAWLQRLFVRPLGDFLQKLASLPRLSFGACAAAASASRRLLHRRSLEPEPSALVLGMGREEWRLISPQLRITMAHCIRTATGITERGEPWKGPPLHRGAST